MSLDLKDDLTIFSFWCDTLNPKNNYYYYLIKNRV